MATTLPRSRRRYAIGLSSELVQTGLPPHASKPFGKATFVRLVRRLVFVYQSDIHLDSTKCVAVNDRRPGRSVPVSILHRADC